MHEGCFALHIGGGGGIGYYWGAPGLKNPPCPTHPLMSMIVNLLQVLSKTVADALEYAKDPRTKQTERFVRMFDRFFDMMNTRSLEECVHKRKPDLAPYRTSGDTRLEVCLLTSQLASNGFYIACL